MMKTQEHLTKNDNKNNNDKGDYIFLKAAI